MAVLCTIFYVFLMQAHTQGMAILLLFAFAFSMAGMNPTAVASAGKMTSVTSMGIMLPVASSGAILMPWIIGMVAENAGLAVGMASNIVPCVGLIVFAILVARMPEDKPLRHSKNGPLRQEGRRYSYIPLAFALNSHPQ